MIFVDTGAWFALLLPQDKNHARARQIRNQERAHALVTSTYVLEELFTLLRMRGASDHIGIAG